MKSSKGILPQENLYRAAFTAVAPTYEVRTVRADAGESGDGRTLELQWYVADRWAEIQSWHEGHFLERIELGAAAKTIKDNRAAMRTLLEHGYDPQLGNKPIAPIDRVEENDLGGYSEGRLFDGLDPLVVDGLRAGVYGASFRFRVMRDEFIEEPEPSEHNPRGIPERTVKEMQVMEFGPVTWGAYSEASAGVRSITDEIMFGSLRRMPQERLAQIAEFWRALDKTFVLDSEHAEDAPSDDDAERREDAPSAEDSERREQDQEAPEAPAGEATPRKAERDYLQPDANPDWFLS